MTKQRIRAALLAALFALASIALPAKAFALSNQIDGTIYWDQNNNGVQDTGEPGVSGVVVNFGWGTGQKIAVTDSSGHYAITGTSGSGRVSVDTGWYRSACNSLNCSVGTAGGNDFPVSNQIISLASVDGSAGATLNAGLVPDWGGTYPIPSSPTSHSTDIAARLTYNSGCSTDGNRVCNTGDNVKLYAWFMNQGTSDLSNPKFVVELPPGHTLNDTSWADPKDVFNVANPSADSVTVLQAYNASKGYGVYQLDGTIPAGANSSMMFTATVNSTATSSATPYATTDPFDKQAELRIIGMDQTGDPDSSLCETNGSDWRTGTCALSQLGVHDKTKSLDHTDGAGWNVSTSTASATPSYDPAATLGLATGQSGSVNAGDLVNFNLHVTNNGTGDSGTRNIQLTDTVPSGMSFSTGDNPGWSLVSGVPTTYITAQLAPGDSIDVPIALRVNSGETTTDNGTSALNNQAQIASFQTNWPNASGVFSTGTDSNSGNNSGAQAITIASGTDTTPPTAPTGLTATTASDTEADLSWTASTDNVGVTEYHIYRDGTEVGTSAGTTYNDTGLTNNTTYHYTVKASDAANNLSAASSESDATTWQQFVGNRSVESNLTGWTDLWGPATTTETRPSGDAHDGSYAIRIDTSSTTGTSAGFTNFTTTNRWVTNTVNAKAYTASAWVKASHTGMVLCVRQTEYNGSTNLGYTETCSTLNDSNWHQISNTKTATGAGHSMTTSIYCSWMKNDRYFLADDFSITAPN